MVQIYRSRFTPGVTGDQVKLDVGERVKYTLLDGMVVNAIVDSERMSHAECPNLGYEMIDESEGSRFFGDGQRITFQLVEQKP
jgi:hypothetical protein